MINPKRDQHSTARAYDRPPTRTDPPIHRSTMTPNATSNDDDRLAETEPSVSRMHAS
jgi:hypothetical protein